MSSSLWSQGKLNYEVDKFDFIMKRQLDSILSIAEMKAGLRVRLQVVDGVYSFKKDAPAVSLTGLEGKVQKYDLSALNAICLEMVRAFNDKGLISIFVGAEAGQIDRQGKDLRTSKVMQLAIWTGHIKQVRTISQGHGFKPEERINNDKHLKIRERSPLYPHAEGEDEAVITDIPDRRKLEAYIHWLNRHPSRNVTVSFSSGLERGDVILDYIVTEFKPWLLYTQFSNTGTEGTGEWRSRLGFVHNQLTSNDDELKFDASVSEFEKSQNYVLSYEFAMPYLNKLRIKPYVSFSDFTSEDFDTDLEFSGETTTLGLDASLTVFQYDELFVDLMLGIRHEDMEVDDEILATLAEEELTYLTAGVSVDRNNNRSNLNLYLGVESLLGSVSEDNLDQLGRLGIDDNWEVLKYSLSYTFFLEPLIFGEKWYSPQDWKSSTLGHELRFHLRGQDSMGNRLIPQSQISAGGLYTVRGYNESATNGDSAVVFSAEYALHIPALLKPGSQIFSILGQDVKVRPRFTYDTADWDLVFRVFYDMAHTEVNDPLTGEFDQDLSAAGIGFDFKYKRFLNLRLDWAMVLEDLQALDGETPDAEQGDSRVHFSLTLIF